MRNRRAGQRPKWALILILLVVASAGCGGSSDPQPDASSDSAATPSAQDVASPTPEDDRALSYPLESLSPGLHRTTGEDGSTLVEFKVPKGWSGEQDGPYGWFLVWGTSFEKSKAFLGVDELDLDFKEATANFKRVKNLDVPDPTAMKVDGRMASLFAAKVTKGDHALLDSLGVPIDVVGWVETRQIFVDLGPNSMIVRIELPKGKKYLPQALKIIRSFTFNP